jgi:hypothetical protein
MPLGVEDNSVERRDLELCASLTDMPKSSTTVIQILRIHRSMSGERPACRFTSSPSTLALRPADQLYRNCDIRPALRPVTRCA